MAIPCCQLHRPKTSEPSLPFSLSLTLLPSPTASCRYNFQNIMSTFFHYFPCKNPWSKPRFQQQPIPGFPDSTLAHQIGQLDPSAHNLQWLLIPQKKKKKPPSQYSITRFYTIWPVISLTNYLPPPSLTCSLCSSVLKTCSSSEQVATAHSAPVLKLRQLKFLSPAGYGRG